MLQAVLTDGVKRILDQFRECFRIRIVFDDMEGQLLKSGMDQPDSRYCQLIQELYTPQPCLEDNACGRSTALREGMQCYRCHAGLMEAVVPLYGDGCLLGYAMIGQIRSTRQPPKHVARDWKAKFGTGELHEAFLQLEYVSNHRLNSILGLFSILANYIVDRHMVSLNVDHNLVHATEYMRAHVHERITLEDVARHVGRSPYSLSHAFRRQLGVSFKSMLTEMKLNRAEELMRGDPGLTVTQVAERLGYDDPFYFSRLYRKYRGQPPSAFLVSRRPGGSTDPATPG